MRLRSTCKARSVGLWRPAVSKGRGIIPPPYIVDHTARIVVKHPDCREAAEVAREYFSPLFVSYICSDFNGKHTFECALGGQNDK